MNLTEACIQKPVFAWMLMAGTVAFGALAASRIGISQLPDVDSPTISVNLTWEGATPEAVENDVVDLVEESLVQVEGVRSISSSARRGGAQVTVELDLARDVDLALQDVQARVSQVQRRLPADVEPPTVSKQNPEDDPILWIGLSGPYSPQALADAVRLRLRDKLQTVPGVGEVTLSGYLERNVRLWLDAERMAARGVTVIDITQALRREHVDLPAGRIEAPGRELSVRVLGEALDLTALRRLAVRQTDAGPVRLEDVALVEDGFEDARRATRVDGAPAQGIGVKKQRGANAVAVADGVRAALAELQPTLPPGMQVGVNFDGTKIIRDSVHEVEVALLLAVLLTAAVCWLFLGSISSTVNVVLAIPMSLFGTVGVIYFLGYTLNTFTVMALSLAVGIVVDDAIMVLENISRHREEGKPAPRAAREGTAEITFAALAATLAVVAIFLPVVFMEGVIGRFFLQFGVTLSVAVLLSYVEAITLAPARCAQLLQAPDAGRGGAGRAVDRAFDRLAAGYGAALARALRWPRTLALLALLAMAAAGWLAARLPRELVPSGQDMSQLLIRLSGPTGGDLGEMERLVRRAEEHLRSRPEVERTFVVLGGSTSVTSGRVFVTLCPPGERPGMSQARFSAEVRRELNGYPGLRAVIQDQSQRGFTAQRGAAIELSVRGPRWEELVESSRRVVDALERSGLAVDVDSDHEVGIPELVVTPDRARCADLGVSVEDVAATVNALIGGARVGKYSSGGRRVDIRMRLVAVQRARPEDLRRLHVRGRAGQLLPLSALVTLEERAALQQITRRERERAIRVTANPAPGHTQEEGIAFAEALEAELPEDVRLVLGGASVTYRESMGSLLFALVVGLAAAYMVLASQFDSLVDPVTVLAILPLSGIGAVAALWVTGHSLNMFSMIGILLLLGIVKKNSILLVDYANTLRAGGLDAATAMARAGPVRLRPILMTTSATLVAAIPTALALGPGAEVRAPMAVAVIGGLLVSTLLSLLVVPACYVLAERARSLRASTAAEPAAGAPAS